MNTNGYKIGSRDNWNQEEDQRLNDSIKQQYVWKLDKLLLNFKIPSKVIVFLNKYKLTMSNSKPKLSTPQTYSQYFILNDYHHPRQQKKLINPLKPHTHKRKTSQLSTLSCKSKNRNSSLNQIKNHTLNKHTTHKTVCFDRKTHKNTKETQKQSAPNQQFSIQRNKIRLNHQNTLSVRRQKLKIDTDRKTKPKITQNLTSRYLKYETGNGIFKFMPKNHITSQGSFANKCDQTDSRAKTGNQTDSRAKTVKNKQDHERTIIPNLKLREKNLELMVSRCSHVMTQYYERITLLRKQNEFLRFQNEELKKNKLEDL